MPEVSSEPVFLLRPLGHAEVEEHAGLLHSLSNYQVPQNPKGNEEWLCNRRDFDDTTRIRRHYVAVHVATDEIIGYASLEQQGSDAQFYRIFLVFDPSRWDYDGLGDFMYQQLLQDAMDLHAKNLALVEYANDLPFLEFLRNRGFNEVGRFSYDGFTVVRLEKSL